MTVGAEPSPQSASTHFRFSPASAAHLRQAVIEALHGRSGSVELRYAMIPLTLEARRAGIGAAEAMDLIDELLDELETGPLDPPLDRRTRSDIMAAYVMMTY